MAKQQTKGAPALIAPPPESPKPVVEPPKPVESSMTLVRRPAGESAVLNFRVSPEFRRAVKTEAVSLDITLGELLQRMYEHWKAAHP